MFAVVGEVAEDGEVDLHQVLTWVSEDSLREQLLSGLPMMSKEVVIGETHAPVQVGMRLLVGSGDQWLVRLGRDRPVPVPAAGAVLTLLESTYVGSGNAKLWHLRPEPRGRGEIQSTALGLTVAFE